MSERERRLKGNVYDYNRGIRKSDLPQVSKQLALGREVKFLCSYSRIAEWKSNVIDHLKEKHPHLLEIGTIDFRKSRPSASESAPVLSFRYRVTASTNKAAKFLLTREE